MKHKEKKKIKKKAYTGYSKNQTSIAFVISIVTGHRTDESTA